MSFYFYIINLLRGKNFFLSRRRLTPLCPVPLRAKWLTSCSSVTFLSFQSHMRLSYAKKVRDSHTKKKFVDDMKKDLVIRIFMQSSRGRGTVNVNTFFTPIEIAQIDGRKKKRKSCKEEAKKAKSMI